MLLIRTRTESGSRIDEAEAPDAEGAVAAARELLREAESWYGRRVVADIYLDGKLIQYGIQHA